MIGSDFKTILVAIPSKCSECGKKLKPGDEARISTRKGKVMKRICMEEQCRLDFDDRFWQEKARERMRAKVSGD